MSTTKQNHDASGAVATTERVEEKLEWWQNPVYLHIAITAGVIAFALLINFIFKFNFFWKLLGGGALIWVGGKMASVKAGPVKLWGNIFKGLGWAFIIIALLNSGFRMVAERTINEIEQGLTESTSETKVSSLVDLRREKMQEMTLGIYDTVVVTAPVAVKQIHDDKLFWWCYKAISPNSVVGLNLQLEVVTGAHTASNQVRFTAESQKALQEIGSKEVKLRFWRELAVQPTCADPQ